MTDSGIEGVSFRPIGTVHSNTSGGKAPAGEGAASVIEIYKKFEEALDGLDGFSHLFVLCYFHRLRPEQIGPLRVKPRRLLNYGLSLEELPLLGVFALDSPTRPNPIGLSLVRLVGRSGRNLRVEGLDLFDGTPVLDIKPYQPQYRPETFAVPTWRSELSRRAGLA
ncbi:MAG TPA: tRNA (N6-threonylcarbamoyladenosine(37)-N6)-methyltransferase TrmO [Nitrososphaerales archaeon]|nr:tRNA (N6-threonylcarbamoyladenosine(37)-N6)-methyltransferase TrmO [Nitrososphaerales archaeon]